MSYEAEQSVLGSMILNPECIAFVQDKLTPDMFLDVKNRKLFTDIIALDGAKTSIDPVTLKNKGTDSEYLVQVMEVVPHAASVQHYTEIVFDTFMTLKLSGFLSKSKAICGDKSTYSEKLTRIETGLRDLAVNADTEIQHISSIKVDFSGENTSHLPTPFKELNDLILGIKNTDMVVIAGRPGMGKTSMMMDFNMHYGMSVNIPTAFFSLEMTAQQLKERMVCTRSGISLKSVKQRYTGSIEHDLLMESQRQIDESKMYLDKCAGLTPIKLKHKLARCKRMYGTQIAFVDYLQRMKSDVKGTKYETTTDISRSIKDIAVDLEIPIVIGSQLNRSVDNREDKHPRMNDFRDTGAIEEDADLIFALYRASYYEEDFSPESELLVLKGREFGTGTVNLEFEPKTTHFIDAEKPRKWM